jgi:hypothetical protein
MKKECECSLRTKLLGDGCEVCNELTEERDELVAWLRVCDDLLKEYAPKYDGCSTEKKVFEILAKYPESK